MTEKSLVRPAVFLDRDGTIIEDTDYLSNVVDLTVFDFALEAVRLLKDNGYLVLVLTNQSGIARGYFDEQAIRSVHDALEERLIGLIDAFYFCPHGPGEGCECRKPGVGMIRRAAEEHSIDLANSWMVGDKKSDVETGFNAGLATALVLTGYGETELATLDRMPDLVVEDLLEAARRICERNN